MAVDFSTELERLTRGTRTIGARMNDRTAVAQTGYALAIEQMCINARHLLRHVCTQAHGATGELVNQFGGLKGKSFACTRQQGLQILQHGWHDKLIAIAARSIEQSSTQFFDVPCLGGQNIGNVIRQDPSRHGEMGRLLKMRFYRLCQPCPI